MESNKSIKSVVLLIFNQCKEDNCDLVNVNKIIEYITPNFDLNSEEAHQLRLSYLFELLRIEGKENNLLISEETFERILQLWIPSIECNKDQLMNENSNDDETIFTGGVHNRLSRSLTNIKQQIDYEREQKLSLCQSWLSDNITNDENSCSEFREQIETIDVRPRSGSPHEDPFTIPINFIRSTPIKRKLPIAISGLQQPNLRFIKLQHNEEQVSFSDSDALYHYEGSYIGDDSSENIGSNKEMSRSQSKRKRHRNSIIGQLDPDNVDNKDLLSQLKQIKFKNTHLMEINDRLQAQLEGAEENLRNLTTKCWNLEKKTKLFNTLSEENKQFVVEIDDIRKCLEKEMEYRRTIMSEKIMTEGELTMSKEHIQSLVDKLSQLDSGLEQKDKMINSLRSMILQQEDFCSKLQELNLGKDEEIMKNEKNMMELTEAIKVYEEKINTIQSNFKSLMPKNDLASIIDKMELSEDLTTHDIGCSPGLSADEQFQLSRSADFRPCNSGSPWSIKVELATQLIDSRGDNPFCEKIFFDDDFISGDDSDDGSFEMLKELLQVLSSLRMTLAKYKDHLETASITIKSNEHFSDEITLSYISYLDDSINLLAASTEKAARCQNQFNETFEFLMKRISNLKNDRKTLIIQNEQLQLQVGDSSSNMDAEIAEKICFLETELRRERLSVSIKQKQIDDLGQRKAHTSQYGRCFNCGKSSVRFSASSDMNQDYLATEALNLERCDFGIQQKRLDLHRSFSNVEIANVYNNGDNLLKHGGILSRKSSTSVDELLLRINQDDDDPMLDDNNDHSRTDARNYYISIDDLTDNHRHKLNLRQQSNIDDLDKIIENSWLDTNTTMDERRASVFAQVFEPHLVNNSSTIITTANTSVTTSAAATVLVPTHTDSTSTSTTGIKMSSNKPKLRTGNSSSSCSSSNDTSDANSIDVNVERQKLAQELEIRNVRMQSRSPVPSLLGVVDDLKSITPTVNEEEQIRVSSNYGMFAEPADVGRHGSRTNSPVSLFDECSATESASMDIPLSSRRVSVPKQTVTINVCDTTRPVTVSNASTLKRPSLPTISIVEVSTNDSSGSYKPNLSEQYLIEDSKTPQMSRALSRTLTLESEGNSLQASMNKSSFSSRASSVVGDDSKPSRRAARQGHKRIRRPYTIAGIGMVSNKIVMEDDNSSNCDGQSMVDDINDIQESIDLLQEMKNTMANLSPEELEHKFNEMSLIYRTDRPTVIDRATDANKKCNKALNNVEQEFNILRHLIKSVAQIVDQPCEFVPRIRASIGVLEKCVEYLSAKSEMLGAVEQEIKMSSVIDVMNEFNIKLMKQREAHLRELEEAKSWRDTNNEMNANGSFDQPRSKRNTVAGKDAKKKFQMLAQKTVTKSSIVRQFAARSGQLSSISDNNDPLGSSVVRSPLGWGVTSQDEDVVDGTRHGVVSDSNRKYRSTKFFPTGGSSEESGEILYQKGLHQGLRLSTDQTLTEMRAEQSRFSSTLDSLGDLVEEYDPLSDDGDVRVTDSSHHLDLKIRAIKDTLIIFVTNLKKALTRSVYVLLALVVIVALLIPWLLSPANHDGGSFSVPTSRRRSQVSLPDTDHHHHAPRSSPSSHSPSPSPSSPSPSSYTPSTSSPLSPSYFSSLNLVRNGPAAI